MKRTRKWKFVEQEARRLVEMGLGPQEVADRLEVDRSTVTRWTQQGKLRFKDAPPAVSTATVRQTPAEWAAAVRAEYQLDVTDDQILTLAQEALEMARSDRGASVRLQAMGRYQTLVRQLALVARRGAETPAAPETPETPSEPERARRPIVPRSGDDPRRILTAVK